MLNDGCKKTLLAINCASKPQSENKSWGNWKAEESFPPPTLCTIYKNSYLVRNFGPKEVFNLVTNWKYAMNTLCSFVTFTSQEITF